MYPTTSPPTMLSRIYQSPIGKKLVTGVTGLGLTLFVVAHMIGNLLMFASHEAYNTYAHILETWGPVFWAVELVLAGVVVLHAATGIYITWGRFQARPVPYTTYASKGGASLQSLSSRSMIVTGLLLASFLVVHLLHFKFGIRYTTDLNGQNVRDLARLVVETFQQPLYAWGYTGIMILLGAHLRHGIWSACQSLGTMAQPYRFVVYGMSLILAIAIAVGFVILPLAIYFHLIA